MKVSYKNHKVIQKEPSEWVVTENTHEPIISQELWDKVREAENAVSFGKRSRDGITRPLSGLIFCPDCGYKMKSNTTIKELKSGTKVYGNFNCSSYTLYKKINVHLTLLQKDK